MWPFKNKRLAEIENAITNIIEIATLHDECLRMIVDQIKALQSHVDKCVTPPKPVKKKAKYAK